MTLKIEVAPSEADADDVVVGMQISSKIPAAKHLPRLARSTPKNQLQLSFDREDDEDA